MKLTLGSTPEQVNMFKAFYPGMQCLSTFAERKSPINVYGFVRRTRAINPGFYLLRRPRPPPDDDDDDDADEIKRRRRHSGSAESNSLNV